MLDNSLLPSRLKASQKGLEILDAARRKKGWRRQAAVWCGEAGASPASQKRLWRGCRIDGEAFVRLCQAVGVNWQEVAELERHPPDWGESVDTLNFVGRTQELSKLTHWILDESCRMVALIGAGGMGKSAFARVLVERVKDNFSGGTIWRSLREARPPSEILTELIQYCSKQQENDLSSSVDRCIERLIYYLEKSRCLIILDNLESILQNHSYAAQYREGYEAYGKLFQRIAQSNHQGCLILTSREKPREIGSIPLMQK
jgi:NB-ARC domain